NRSGSRLARLPSALGRASPARHRQTRARREPSAQCGLPDSRRRHALRPMAGRRAFPAERLVMKLDVYLYGMTVLSTIHRCASVLPPADGYAEIVETHVCPGGEAMNGAMLLSGLGLRVGIGGPHWGSATRD